MNPLVAIFKKVNGKKTRVDPPKSFLAVVLRCKHEYAFLSTKKLRDASPILLNFDGVHDHALAQIKHILDNRDIRIETIDLPPVSVSLRPFVDLMVNLAVVTVSPEEMSRVKVNGFTTVTQSEISLYSDSNMIFGMVSQIKTA